MLKMMNSVLRRIFVPKKTNISVIRSYTVCAVHRSNKNSDTELSLAYDMPPHLRDFLTDLKERKLKREARDYENWEKWELIVRIKQLEENSKRQRKVILKYNQFEEETGEANDDKTIEIFKSSKLRRIALRVMYLGFDYQGLVFDPGCITKTILAEVRKALTKGRLIKSWEDANVIQSGRTDREVSAFNQVLMLNIRSNQLEGKGVYTPENYEENENKKSADLPKSEIDYTFRLNRRLPQDIRVLAWAPVDLKFNPRHDCKMRTYKYYFLKQNLDVEAMQEAANLMVGLHDFRNFCKGSLRDGVVDFKREVYKANLSPVDNFHDVMVLTIQATSFLWHQIRYMTSVLFLVGQGKEKAEIVPELLDVEKNPRRPQYVPAKAYPLILFDCKYDEDLEWQYSEENLLSIFKQYRRLETETYIKAALIGGIVNGLGQMLPSQTTIPTSPGERKPYKPLFERVMMRSIEEQIEERSRKLEALKEMNS